jgi:hypothetical protein
MGLQGLAADWVLWDDHRAGWAFLLAEPCYSLKRGYERGDTMDQLKLKIEGCWNMTVSGGVAMTGKAIGLSIDFSGGVLPNSQRGGGVLDYNDVAKLHEYLGRWLLVVEDNKRLRKKVDRLRKKKRQQAKFAGPYGTAGQ